MKAQALVDFFQQLDRSYFIDSTLKPLADFDTPLPIGYEQTISQPSLVLEMTQILNPDLTSKVLEIGTGSGYQTALLAEFSKTVYTIERIPDLSKKAKERLDALGYSNIVYQIADGSTGLSEYAPYDRIIVTAAAGEVPDELIDQLAPDGVLLIPVGESGFQNLMKISKDQHGHIDEKTMLAVRFVEMKGKYGWSKKTKGETQ